MGNCPCASTRGEGGESSFAVQLRSKVLVFMKEHSLTVDQMFDLFDTGPDGVAESAGLIDEKDFRRSITAIEVKTETYSKQQILDAFSELDRNGDRRLDRKEFYSFLGVPMPT